MFNGLLFCLVLVCFQLTNQYKYQNKKNFEIPEDFTLTFEYALEKTSKDWLNRGTIEFYSKNSAKNYKSNALVINKEFSKEEKENINNECQKDGLIIVRVKLPSINLISSIKAVSLYLFFEKLVRNCFNKLSRQNYFELSRKFKARINILNIL